MTGLDWPFRHIHLDFHTSEQIDGIGADFDPEEFADTLVEAHVNSVCLFGRCHHGWIYYDTAQFPERRHPHLTRNLLAEQIEACHARGIRAPIYVTIQWDHYTATQHPEWVCLLEDGRQSGTPPYQAGFYRNLCVNTPYRDFLKAHVREIFELLPVDGFFFDIVKPEDCSCRYCRAGMEEQGLDPSQRGDRGQYALQVINEFKRDMTAFVRRFSPDCSIFYNAGHIGPRHREVAEAYTHWELESLPSGGWGYLHFPLTVRYARTLGLDCMSHTGKFHTSWGDFHGFKNPAALQFECFLMLAMGAKCGIGDQLHPRGRICPDTYRLISPVYGEVERKEPWCRGARPVTEIGVFNPEEFTGDRIPAAAAGAVRMLQEGHHQFDVLDSASDLTAYRVVMLPDQIPVDRQLAARLEDYLQQGGALIASHRSGLRPDGADFALASLGVRLMGEAPFSPDFIVPQGDVGAGLPATEHVMYLKGMEVETLDGSEILAPAMVPYFNRTWRHFCSHRHTPSAGREGYPAIVRNGQAIYFAHPIFTQYNQNAPLWCKKLLLNALDLLLPDPLVRTEAPSSAVVTLNEQSEQDRLVLHLLHYIPERRGQDFDVIEDVIPLYDVRVSVRMTRRVTAVTCVPQGLSLEFQAEGGRVEFVVPVVRGHQMVVIA